MTSAKDTGIRGIKLFELFEQTLDERKDNRGDILEKIGFTEAYYGVYRRGDRWIGTVSHEKLEEFAKYLKVPLANVYLLAEILKPSDFVDRDSLPKKFAQLYDILQGDDSIRPFLPSNDVWAKTPVDSKLLIYFMFKQITGKEIQQLADELKAKTAIAKPTKKMAD
jgi:hypothetical protein